MAYTFLAKLLLTLEKTEKVTKKMASLAQCFCQNEQKFCQKKFFPFDIGNREYGSVFCGIPYIQRNLFDLAYLTNILIALLHCANDVPAEPLSQILLAILCRPNFRHFQSLQCVHRQFRIIRILDDY
jgi:hypothetical protein